MKKIKTSYRDRLLMAWKDHAASRMGLTGIAWMLGLAGLSGLTGCSGSGDGDDAPEKPLEVAISFSSELAPTESVTRAASTVGLEKYETEFNVWCFKQMEDASASVVRVMDPYLVRWTANTAKTTVTNTNDWEYVGVAPGQPIRYWDLGAESYRFFGLIDGNGANEKWTLDADLSDDTQRAYKAQNVNTESGKVPYYSKLWHSTMSKYREESNFGKSGKPVQLVFQKPMARVRFYFRKNDPDMLVQVTDAQLKPATNGQKIDTQGTFTVIYPISNSATNTEDPTDTGYSTTEHFKIDATGGLDALTDDFFRRTDAGLPDNPETYAGRWYSVLPKTNQGAYSLTVKINGVPKTATVPATYMDWLPNYEYTYIFIVTETREVKLESVQTAFTPWVEDKEGNYEVYNW